MASRVKTYGVRYLKRTAFRRGVVGSDRLWLAVWVAVAGSQFLRRRLGRIEEVVYRTELHVGEHLIVEHHPPAARRRRRQKAAQNQP